MTNEHPEACHGLSRHAQLPACKEKWALGRNHSSKQHVSRLAPLLGRRKGRNIPSAVAISSFPTCSTTGELGYITKRHKTAQEDIISANVLTQHHLGFLAGSDV